MRATLQRWLLAIFCLYSCTAASSSNQIIDAEFDQPSDVAVSEDGRVWVLDGVNARVVVTTAAGDSLFSFGREGDGDGELQLPMGITLDKTRVYIADTDNHRISIFNQHGEFLEKIELAQQEPVALAIAQNELFWSDRRNHQVCRLHLHSDDIPHCWGRRGSGEGEFDFPFQIAIDSSGYINVVDVLNQRVQQFHRSGRFIRTTDGKGVLASGLYRPNGITFSDDGKHMFVSDTYFGTIAVFVHSRYAGVMTDVANEVLRFNTPVGITYADQSLFVVEAQSDRIQVVGVEKLNTSFKKTPLRSSNAAYDRACVLCHVSWESSYSTGYEKSDLEPAVSTMSMCYSCHHGAVIDSRKSIAQGQQHPDQHHKSHWNNDRTLNGRADVIPDEFVLLKNTGPAENALGCGSCHTPHSAGDSNGMETLYPDHHNNWLRVSNDDGMLCQKCHQSKSDEPISAGPRQKGRNHPLGIPLDDSSENTETSVAVDNGRGKTLPEPLLKHGGVLGQQQELVCQSCHQIHGGAGKGLTVLPATPSGLCESCHTEAASESQAHARKKGVHPVGFDLSKRDKPLLLDGDVIEEITCLSCHSVHEGRAGSANLSNVADSTEKLCAACHEDQHATSLEEAQQKSLHPVNIELEEPVIINDESLTRIQCLTCHSMHNGVPDTPALVESHRNGKLCSHCHSVESDVVISDHNLVVSDENHQNTLQETPEQAGVCGSCHSLHRASDKQGSLFIGANMLASESAVDSLQRDQLCLGCHKTTTEAEVEKSVVEHYSHPSKNMILRSEGTRMPLLDANEDVAEFGQIACITCHSAHEWSASHTEVNGTKEYIEREGDANSSFLRLESSSQSFCISCHGIETMVKYKYFHDELSRDKKLPYFNE